MNPLHDQQDLNTFSLPPVDMITWPGMSHTCHVLRLDQLDAWTSGNKFFKLKYVLPDAIQRGVTHVVSKGGMFSNHLAALADACVFFKVKLTAIVRSYTPDENNPTIIHLRSTGAEVLYLAPVEFNAFDETSAEALVPGALFIPSGGLSPSGIKGTAEIAACWEKIRPTHVIVPGGTMGTALGLMSSCAPQTTLIIVPAWKGCTYAYIDELISQYGINPRCRWTLWPDGHFSGFGKTDAQLLSFMETFSAATGIPLDPVYTGKMMYAIDAKLTENYFSKDAVILAIHTGGLQGLQGFAYRQPAMWSDYALRFGRSSGQ